MNTDEVVNAALLSIQDDIRLNGTDVDKIPKGSLFNRCAAIIGNHELKHAHSLKNALQQTVSNNLTSVPLSSETLALKTSTRPLQMEMFRYKS